MEVVLSSLSGRILLGFALISIGRLPTNQVVLGNDNQVSGRHAEIHPTGQGYTLTDLGSTNGTFVNRQRLAPYVPYMLKLHDTIRIGQTTFTFEMNSQSALASSEQQRNVPREQSPYNQQPFNQHRWISYPQQNGTPISVPYPPIQPQFSPYYVQPTIQPMIFNQSSFQAVTVHVGKSQYGCLVRACYFVFIGWWLGLIWVIIALALCASIIGAPIGFVMFNQLPGVLTLQQH
jgi:FHA domain/Inner membrane component domain